MAQKRRRNILDETRGYRFARSKKKAAAREAIYHAQQHAFAHRKDKKNDFRQLWITRINAALTAHGMKYSRFIKSLKDKGVGVDRKILATFAKDRPEVFARVVEKLNG